MTIHDISNTGLLLETAFGLAEGQKLDIDLPELGRTQATVVWASARFFGCRFNAPVPKAAISAALLRNPVTPAEHATNERAWEALGAQLAPAQPDTDPAALSFAAKSRVILGASLALWAVILWGVGVL